MMIDSWRRVDAWIASCIFRKVVIEVAEPINFGYGNIGEKILLKVCEHGEYYDVPRYTLRIRRILFNMNKRLNELIRR
jgi:hypothetical protein